MDNEKAVQLVFMWSKLKIVNKLAMVTIANFYNEKLGGSNISIGDVAKYCNISHKLAEKAVNKCLESGELSKTTINGDTVYIFNLPGFQ